MTSDSDKAYNLQFLKKSRLREGDIFTLSIGGSYIFGRLLKTKLSFDNSPFGLSNLIYIYDVRSSSPDIDYSRLTPDHLLIPPMFVSNVLWARGYAMKVANMLITKGDLLEQHCFYSSVHKTYYDESKNELHGNGWQRAYFERGVHCGVHARPLHGSVLCDQSLCLEF